MSTPKADPTTQIAAVLAVAEAVAGGDARETGCALVAALGEYATRTTDPAMTLSWAIHVLSLAKAQCATGQPVVQAAIDAAKGAPS